MDSDASLFPGRGQPHIRAILEAIPDDLMLVNADGMIREYKAGRSQKHLPMDAFLGTHLKELLHAEQFQQVMEAIKLALQGEPTREIELQLDQRDFEARMVAMEGDTVLVLFRDVSAQKEIERLKAEFIAAVSHELNTPLASILGFTELLLNGLYSAEELPEFLDNIQSSTLRLKDMVSNLLDSSRLEAGRFEVYQQPINLLPTLEQVAKSFAGVAKLSKIDFRVELQSLPIVEADANRIAQVVGNLLSNAFKFCKGGTIWLRALEHNGVKIEIEDTGPGISPQEQSLLFTRYGRTQSATRRGIAGTGLGLYISKAIIEAHHGRIWLDSPPGEGEGSLFSVWLPRSQTLS